MYSTTPWLMSSTSGETNPPESGPTTDGSEKIAKTRSPRNESQVQHNVNFAMIIMNTVLAVLLS